MSDTANQNQSVNQNESVNQNQATNQQGNDTGTTPLSLTQKLALVQTDLIAPKSQFNSFGKYKYRSCEDILKALKEHLAKHQCVLLLSDEIVAVGNRIYVKATATLSDGTDTITATAFARESETKKGMDDSQITGTASSYARKYALNGLFAIDDTADADTMDNRSNGQNGGGNGGYNGQNSNGNRGYNTNSNRGGQNANANYANGQNANHQSQNPSQAQSAKPPIDHQRFLNGLAMVKSGQMDKVAFLQNLANFSLNEEQRQLAQSA